MFSLTSLNCFLRVKTRLRYVNKCLGKNRKIRYVCDVHMVYVTLDI